jgi:hypothetical protein
MKAITNIIVPTKILLVACDQHFIVNFMQVYPTAGIPNSVFHPVLNSFCIINVSFALDEKSVYRQTARRAAEEYFQAAIQKYAVSAPRLSA